MLEQQIRLDAVLSNGKLIVRKLASNRANGIIDAVTRLSVADVPQVLSRLFPLCGMAHAAAGLEAIEAALQIAVSPLQRKFRELMLLAEHGAALSWRIMMDWPPLLGGPPNTRGCADIRRAVIAVSAAAKCHRWVRLGGVRLELNRGDLAGAASELAHMLLGLFPEAADPALTWPKLKRALQSGASVPARLINTARVRMLADYGRHDRPLLPSVGAEWFSMHLESNAAFGRAPTFDGMPAEVGPLAAQRHPLIADAVADWGQTLATRLLAAALDAPAVARCVTNAVEGIGDDDPVEFDLTRTGRGSGVVETARGPLAYSIDTASGRASRLRSAAPTEWNFHPDGPFVAALKCAPKTPDPIFAARLLAASFDPCVPLRIELTDGERTPMPAEVARHA
jgi:coenzyme F420-reducing hydrogenase alpha subunit